MHVIRIVLRQRPSPVRSFPVRVKILELAILVDAQRELSMSSSETIGMSSSYLQVHCSCAWCLGHRGA